MRIRSPPPTADTTPDVCAIAFRSGRLRLYRNQGVFLGSRAYRARPTGRCIAMGTLAPGTYALEFHDWRHVDFDTPLDPPTFASDYPERVCFDFTLN